MKSVSEHLNNLSAKTSLQASLQWIKRTQSIESLELLLTKIEAKYHKKICLHKYSMENKCSSEGGSQKAEQSRAKHKSSTETVASIEYVFCGEKERYLI